MPSITTLQMLGLAGVLSYAAARFAAKAGVLGYNRYTLIAVPLAGMPAMPRGLRVEPLSPRQLAAHVIDADAATQAHRFAQGLTCLGAFDARDRLLGVNWVGLGSFAETEIHARFVLPAGIGWDCGLWIDPEFRLGRAFAALWAGTADWLRKHDGRYSVSWIADYNLPSLRSHRRMGSVAIGHLTAFRLHRWQYMNRGEPRFVRIDRADPPLLDLSHALAPIIAQRSGDGAAVCASGPGAAPKIAQ